MHQLDTCLLTVVISLANKALGTLRRMRSQEKDQLCNINDQPKTGQTSMETHNYVSN